MRASIITFQESSNNGALLQAYALQTVLTDLTGEKCDIINYHSAHKAKDYKNHNKKEILVYLNRLLSKRIRNTMDKKAAVFKDTFLNITGKVYYCLDDLKELNSEYDNFVCGSDQVWNPNNTGGDEAFLLSFVADDSKLISYAPSIALSKIPDEFKEIYKRNILRFTHLSVREKSGKNIIKDLTNKDAKVVLDPTLLLDSHRWNTILQSIETKEPYIFVYCITHRPQLIEYAKKLRKHTGLPIVMAIHTVRDVYICRKNGFRGMIVSPQEFVGAIANAEHVITNSFHATVFSVNYQVNMSIFGNKGRMKDANNRMKDILTQLHLGDRFIDDSSEYNILTDDVQNFDEVIASLHTMRKESMDFLGSALSL